MMFDGGKRLSAKELPAAASLRPKGGGATLRSEATDPNRRAVRRCKGGHL